MGELVPMDGEVRRRVAERLVLRRVNARLDRLERLWYSRSSDKVAAELVAIGHELVNATPLFLPAAITEAMKGGDGRSGPEVGRNGHLLQVNGQARAGPGGAAQDAAWETLAARLEALADKLEAALRRLGWDGQTSAQP